MILKKKKLAFLFPSKRLLLLQSEGIKSKWEVLSLEKYKPTQAFRLICLSVLIFPETNKLRTCACIFDTSQGLAKKAIYSHALLTTGTYALKWNAIQNAENIFSSCQQTAKGTSGSSPRVRTVISVTVWTFNYCNPLLHSFKNIGAD